MTTEQRSPATSGAGISEVGGTRIALGRSGQPQTGVLTIGSQRQLQMLGQPGDERTCSVAIVAVHDLDGPSRVGGSGVAAPHPIHRPPTRIEDGIGESVNLVRTVAA